MENDNKIKSSRKNVIIIVVIAALLIIGGTFAATFFSALNGNYAYKTTCFDIIYDKGEDMTGVLFPSSIDKSGLSGYVTIGIDPSCNVDAKGNLYLNVNSNNEDNNKFVSSVAAHCENKNTLETLSDYTDADSCEAVADGVWVEDGTALKYSVYSDDNE